MTYYVSMTDKFMSGLGLAKNQINKFIIECENYQQAEIIEKNARLRPEMKYINICCNRPRNRSGYLLSFRKYEELGNIWKQ